MASPKKRKIGKQSSVKKGKHSRSAVSGRSTIRSGVSGRYVGKREVSSEAKEFSRRFNEDYRETLRDLSER